MHLKHTHHNFISFLPFWIQHVQIELSFSVCCNIFREKRKHHSQNQTLEKGMQFFPPKLLCAHLHSKEMHLQEQQQEVHHPSFRNLEKRAQEWVFLFLSVETEGRETTTAAAAEEERKFGYPISEWRWYTLGTPSVGPPTRDKAFDPAPKISKNQVKPTIHFRNAHTRCSS